MRLRIATSGTDHSRDTAVRSSFAIGGGFLSFKLWPTICWSLSQHWLSRSGQTQHDPAWLERPWGQWPHENVLSARRATKLWLVPPAGLVSHGFFWWVADGFLMGLSVDLLLIGGCCWFAELAKSHRTSVPVMILTLSDAKAVLNSGMGIPILTDLETTTEWFITLFLIIPICKLQWPHSYSASNLHTQPLPMPVRCLPVEGNIRSLQPKSSEIPSLSEFLRHHL